MRIYCLQWLSSKEVVAPAGEVTVNEVHNAQSGSQCDTDAPLSDDPHRMLEHLCAGDQGLVLDRQLLVLRRRLLPL